MIDEQEFRLRCDEAMAELYQALSKAAEERGFDVDYNNGALTVEFDEPKTKFVVSPNAPVRQIWVSALVKSFRFDWDPKRQAFLLVGSGATLKELMGEVISQHLGETVRL
ncbi:MAG: iron donor protein CyaY [Bryobacteraceae bacterium]|nr:iron donor protein CyaY [Bryobacteraceae bacterium]MDW8377251.1 iron donor protein CyaY [Bryobacterales bacterium]